MSSIRYFGQKSARHRPELNISPIKSNMLSRRQDSDDKVDRRGKVCRSSILSIRPAVLVNDDILHKLSQVMEQLNTNECIEELDVAQTPVDSHFEICSIHERGRNSAAPSCLTDNTLELPRNPSNMHLDTFVDDMMDNAIDEVVLTNKCLQTECLDTSSFVRPKVLRKKSTNNGVKCKNNLDISISFPAADEMIYASTSRMGVEEERDCSRNSSLGFSRSRSGATEPVLLSSELAYSDGNKSELSIRDLDLSPAKYEVQHANTTPSKRGPVSVRKSPFYLAQNEDPSAYMSHSIKAHEQQLMNRIQCRYPHWRTFVSNLLKDPATGDDVAIIFLKELESRKQMRKNHLKRSNIENLHREDDHILSQLKQALSTANGYDRSSNQFLRPTRMRQLRILNIVLSNC